jgi:hypothetical protein
MRCTRGSLRIKSAPKIQKLAHPSNESEVLAVRCGYRNVDRQQFISLFGKMVWETEVNRHVGNGTRQACSGRAWLTRRLQELAGIFSIAVGGFSVLDSHLHVLVRLDPEVAAGSP